MNLKGLAIGMEEGEVKERLAGGQYLWMNREVAREDYGYFFSQVSSKATREKIISLLFSKEEGNKTITKR